MQNKTIAFSITPKGVMNEIHHHIFYQYVTSDDVIFWIYGQGDHKGSPLRINPSDVYRDNYAFCIDHDTHVCIDHDTHVRASLHGAMPYFIG